MAKLHQYTPTKPTDPHVITATVLRRAQISPHVIRITLGGPGLQQFTPLGYDQWFRLFLSRDDQGTLTLPTRTSVLWYAQYLATAKDRRPWVRNYTVRAFRAEGARGNPELDIDFIVHGVGTKPASAPTNVGPAVGWALHAQPGEQVGLLDQGLSFEPARRAPWTLLVSDETGLPAVAGILNSLAVEHPEARGAAFIETPDAADAQEITAPAGFSVHWLARTNPHATPGQLALETVIAAELPAEVPYCFAVGEARMATGVRRHLVNERGVPKTNVGFVGYWREGVATSS